VEWGAFELSSWFHQRFNQICTSDRCGENSLMRFLTKRETVLIAVTTFVAGVCGRLLVGQAVAAASLPLLKREP
jgi:hypothetical protein